MTTELAILAWGCVLAIVYIWASIRVKTRQYGVQWNIGPRDEDVPSPQPIVGRLARAQANFFETFPLFVAAVLIVSVAHLNDRWTVIGAWLWLGGRVAYLPLYAMGVKGIRTAAWMVSIVGIAMLLTPALMWAFR